MNYGVNKIYLEASVDLDMFIESYQNKIIGYIFLFKIT